MIRTEKAKEGSVYDLLEGTVIPSTWKDKRKKNLRLVSGLTVIIQTQDHLNIKQTC